MKLVRIRRTPALIFTEDKMFVTSDYDRPPVEQEKGRCRITRYQAAQWMKISRRMARQQNQIGTCAGK